MLEARTALESVIQRLTSLGRLYSNGYQVRVGDVATHDALFCDLLVHPSILFLVKAYLANTARCATWSSNTLLPNMDQ